LNQSRVIMRAGFCYRFSACQRYTRLGDRLALFSL
jgi:hypothetical protein